MNIETISWAIDAAHALHKRHYERTGLLASDGATSLIAALLTDPAPTDWDEVVAIWMSGTSSTNVASLSLQKRISRARDLLARAAAGVNTENLRGHPALRNRARAYNMLILAQLLHTDGYRDSSIISYKSALHIAESNQLWDIALQALKQLRTAAAVRGDRAIVAKYERNMRNMQSCLQDELEADTLVAQAQLQTILYTNHTSQSTAELQKIISRLTHLSRKKHSASVIAILCYRVELWLASLQADATTSLRLARKAIAFFDAHPHIDSIGYRAEFQGARMAATVITGDVAEATQTWNAMSPLLPAGGDGWNTLLRLYFLVCTTHRAYEEARDALWTYISTRSSGLSDLRMHAWSVDRAYIELLIDTGRVAAGPFQGKPRLYLGNLERRQDRLIGDKAITGAALLILRLIHWIRVHKYSEFIAAVERCRQYAARYLNNPQTLRTGVFLRMLASIPSADFDPDMSDKRGREIMAKQKAAMNLVRDHAEIIPYEELWSIVIEALRARGSQRRR
jgi:hypothetical protein